MMANDLISRKALLAEYDRVHIGKPGKARKLIELLVSAGWAADKEGFYNVPINHAVADFIADYLIANGVTLQEHDCFWATEQAYKNGYAKGVRDFVEQLKDYTHDIVLYGEIVTVSRIDSLAEEMLEPPKGNDYGNQTG